MSLIWNCENAFFYSLITFIMSFSSFINGCLPENIKKQKEISLNSDNLLSLKIIK